MGNRKEKWAALADGQKTVGSSDYQRCLPVLKQPSAFSSSTSTKANSRLIIGVLEEG